MSFSVAGAASGAAGGLAMGGPVGAGLGAIAGLFGGGGEQSTEAIRREYTPEEQAAVSRIMKMYPGALEAMSPEAREEVFKKISGIVRTQGTQEVNRLFDAQQEQLDVNTARTGGGLGSINLYQTRTLAEGRSSAQGEVNRSAVLTGEQVAGNRANEAMNRVNTLGGQYAQFDQLRNIGQTTTGQDNPLNAGFGLLGMAATMENSYLNKKLA